MERMCVMHHWINLETYTCIFGDARNQDFKLSAALITFTGDVKPSVPPHFGANLRWFIGETECRDSLLTNSMQTSWSVDGETDCRDSLLTNSMQSYGR